MLSDVLSKEECAACRICCSFRRQSLWELPKLSPEFAASHKKGFSGRDIKYIMSEAEGVKWAVTDLTDSYATSGPEEEVPCPFLDPDRGCTLPPEEKPFECSAWPLRFMRMPGGGSKICMSEACPAMQKADPALLAQKTEKEWGQIIRSHVKEHPYMETDHRDGYKILE